MPPCESYDGTGDPMEHLARFTSGMNLHLVPNQIMCRAFPVTLKGAAHVWFQHLAPRSISCWAQLAESFRNNFLTSRIQRKNSSALFRIVQGPKESLKSYYTCFNTEKLLIDNLDSGVTFEAMAKGVHLGTPLRFSLNKRPPEHMTDLLDRVEKYFWAEEDSMTTTQDEGISGQKRRDRPEGKIPEEPKSSRTTLSKHFTPLTTSWENILNQIKGQDILKWPKPMRMPADRRDCQLYCQFYKDHGHTTEECKVLRREIVNLIARGHLKQFVKTNERQGGKWGGGQIRHDDSAPKEPPVINTISGGLSSGGTSRSAQKASARQVNLMQGPAKRPKAPATIDDTDLEEVITPHDDALVISLQIDAYVIKCISVDIGSSTDILFEEAFSQIKISRERICPVSTHWVAKGDQAIARKCYMDLCKAEEALAIEDQCDEHTFRRAELVEELVSITLGANESHQLKIGSMLEPALRDQLWTAECQNSFEALKEYLTAPPLLSKPLAGEELFLYLAIAELAALADFIVECTLSIEDEEQLPQQEGPFTWTLHVDGSSNANRSGAGLILHARYTIVDDVLYKRSFTLPYLRCFTPTEATYALREVHEGICGQHLGGKALAHKILCQGYYWPIMQQGTLEHIKKCDACQRFSPVPKLAPTALTTLNSPILFAMWDMNILGPFPPASAQQKFVIVAIDYFTKWVKAKALSSITEQKCEDFFWRSVVCRFGIPRVLVTDNGRQFDNHTFRAFCTNLSIKQRFTSVAHPQTNG
ncbi:hypothetical protein RJ639_040290 [Escallonia herrerae]|uniref:Integrase catalytic domain-containing protein n=1 Tax=Escallonia herrerae TaxID=1293975 RepID=A0AA88WIS4_9ASTE|nr:hypothetical protein RJ639_040290 [Escallonia herrerae]